MAINIVGTSGKILSSLGKIGVCPEKFFDSQNGTLTENFFGDEGGDGGVGGKLAEKNILSRGPKVAEKGPRHKMAPCSSVTLLCSCMHSQRASFVRGLEIRFKRGMEKSHITCFHFRSSHFDCKE